MLEIQVKSYQTIHIQEGSIMAKNMEKWVYPLYMEEKYIHFIFYKYPEFYTFFCQKTLGNGKQTYM